MTTAPITVTLTMPIILTREMSPNGREGVYGKARVVKRLREDARRATISHVNDPAWLSRGGREALAWGAAGVAVTLDIAVEWPKGRQPWDTDNIVAACKPVRDGIADALWDGQDGHVTVGAVTQTHGSGGLTLRLTAQEQSR